MKPRQTLLKLTTWGGLATGLLSATAVLSASLGSFFEPSDDPTAQSWCYTWTLVNTTPEVADGLRLTVEGPKDVARFYEGPANPFGKPVSHGLTPLGYEVHFQGGAVEPGREVQVGLCTRSRVAQPGGAEDRPAYEWTLGGKPLPGQEQPTAPGQAWGYEGEGEGPFRPYVTLTNPGRVALHVYQLEWARTDRAFPPEQIDWEQLDGSVQWMPLEAERVVPAAPSPEESGTLFARLPLETQPDDASLVLVRAWLQPEDGREPVRLVSQVQLAALFVPEKISEASTVRWSALTFPADKVQPGLRERLKAAGTLPFLVFLPRQADLSQVAGIQDWNERGQQVLQQLRATAEESQGSLRGFLADQQKLGRVESFETFYIVNAVAVTGGSEALETLVRREDVAYVEALDTFYLPEPVSSEPTGGVSAQSAWDSVGRVGAPAVWSQFGLNGAGVVVANIDTGVQWNHPSLMNQYRGTATGSHNFNWFDATTYNPNNPSSPSYRQVPYDNNGHGTHTIGTIAGSGGIGVAPGARWIAARVGDRSLPAVNLLRAGEWILAPFAPAAGLGPDSSRRPHVVNNSWGGPGGNLWYQGIISNWRAAGILPVFSAGNSGSRRRTLGSPGDYAESFTVGATNSGDNIAGFSSRGPSTLTGEMKPDVVAPGVSIRSAWPGSTFRLLDGTSMAAPHVAGCAALMFQASPLYRSYLELLESFMTQTAVDRGSSGPDVHYGYGRLNCFAAVQQAVNFAPNLRFMAPGVGWEAQGADLAMGQIDANPRPDVVMMAYDAPPGANTFRYRIGWNLGTDGAAASWTPGFITVPGVGWEGQGAGAALHDLDGNGRPELVLMAVDNPPGNNSYRYIIGWNLSTSGVAASWSSSIQISAPGWEAQGGAIAIANLGGSSRPDLVLMMYDNPMGANTFRYAVGWDLSTTGVASSWSPTQFIPGVGWEGQGAGVAIANLGRGSRPDIILMAYDNPPGANTFRYRIGWDLGTGGTTADWGGWVTYMVDGLGWEAQGAGVAVNDVDANGIPNIFLMAYDNPYGPNTFRYRVIQ